MSLLLCPLWGFYPLFLCPFLRNPSSYRVHSIGYILIFIPQNIYAEGWKGKIQVKEGKLGFDEKTFADKKNEVVKDGHVYKFYWYDEKAYCEYNLVFSGMPIVSLQTKETLDETQEVWSGTVEIYDVYRTSQFYQKYDCVFNVRGASTKRFPKKSYKVELTDKKTSVLGMRTDDDWIMNALYDDAGLIHNKVSMEIWDEITGYNSVKGDEGYDAEYAEVFLDGQYQGVYLVGERVDEKQLELKENDILYKCRAMRIPEEHNYTNEETDDLPPIFWLKYPKVDIVENWQPIKNWANCFLKFETTDYEVVSQMLNMENAIDYNLYCLLIGGGDNTRKNLFFTAQYQGNGSYQLIKNPWDLNATLGNRWTGISEGNNTTYVEESYQYVRDWSCDVGSLYYMNETEVSSLLYNRWKELRQNFVITEEKIDSMIDVQFSYLHDSGAYKRNYDLWPHGTELWSDSYIYDYVEKRIPFLDKYFEELYSVNVNGYIYKGVDYSDVFDVRYYWEKHYDVLSEIYDYNVYTLLEHFVHYGSPYGMQGRPNDWSEIPVRED